MKRLDQKLRKCAKCAKSYKLNSLLFNRLNSSPTHEQNIEVGRSHRTRPETAAGEESC